MTNQEWNELVEMAYRVARGTELLGKVTMAQMYWKGRADAASDVRKLKVLDEHLPNQ